MKKYITSLAAIIALAFSFIACTTPSSSSDDFAPIALDNRVFALVNIPFDKFFEAETTDGKYDAYSSATQKTSNGSMCYGTYSKDNQTAGISYPVKISLSDLKSLGGEEISDSTPYKEITTSGRGGTSTVRYIGKQLLFHSGDFAYYILKSAPVSYKEASVSGSSVSFGKIKGNTKKIDTLYVTIAAGESHHEFSPAITLYVKDDSKVSANGIPVKKLTFAEIGDSVQKVDGEKLTEQKLSALRTIIATSAEGKSYGLTVLNNMFWGKSQMGFQAPSAKSYLPQHELVGKKISEFRFVTEKEVYVAKDFLVGKVTDDIFVPVTSKDKLGIEYPEDFVIPNIAGSNDKSIVGTELSKADFAEVSGTYDELFAVTNKKEYDSIWETAVKNCGIPDEMVSATANMLKNACAAKIYGEAAIKAYAKNPEKTAFDCFFINGVRKLTFDGNKVSGSGAGGKKLFEYEYYNLGEYELPTPEGTMTGVLYETMEPNAGEFKYFYMMPDTPASTYHLEFRYGSNREDLAKFGEGPYAYWLAAGISENADEEMITNVITLFCEESLLPPKEEVSEK